MKECMRQFDQVILASVMLVSQQYKHFQYFIVSPLHVKQHIGVMENDKKRRNIIFALKKDVLIQQMFIVPYGFSYSWCFAGCRQKK